MRHRDYSTLSPVGGFEWARLDVAASLTARVTSRATAGLTWQSRAYYANVPDARRGAATGTIGVGRRTSLYFGASRTLVERRWATGAFASLGVSLGPRSALNLSTERERDVSRTVVDVQRALPYGTGYGYHVQTAAGGASTDLDAELRAQSSFGRFAVARRWSMARMRRCSTPAVAWW